jgi:serine/arginine repetitive matrix protein 2
MTHESAKEQEQEFQHEIEHGRERNWNAPHPKWDIHLKHHGRPVSPMPHSLAHSSSSSDLQSHSHSHARVRADSLHTPGTKGSSTLHSVPRKPLEQSSPTRSLVKSPRDPSVTHTPGKDKSLGSHRATGFPARPLSPLPPLHKKPGEHSPSGSPASGSRFAWQFPRSRTPLPPLELEEHSPQRPSFPKGSHSRTSSSPTLGPTSTAKRSRPQVSSQIPVKSPKKIQFPSESHDSPLNKRATPEFSTTAGEMPPDMKAEQSPESSSHEDPVLGECANQNLCALNITFASIATAENSPPRVNTPTSEQVAIPSPARSESPPPLSPRRSAIDDEARLQALTSSTVIQELSPPLTPASDSSVSDQSMLPLSTPPRRPSFSSSKVDFQSPSPPKGVPELPGPPSSSEDDDKKPSSNLDSENRKDVTTAMTPRPPGAWTSTPVQPFTTETPTPFPFERQDSRQQNGLATPVPSLSRAGSLTLQTPAPPGGWLSTPNRKSILKVRFDVENPDSEISASENGRDPTIPGALQESPRSESGSGTGFASTINGDVATPLPMENKGPNTDVRAGTPVSHTASVTTSPRSPRKSPSIRLVDAFGREQVSSHKDVNNKRDKVDPSSSVDDTFRSRGTATVRIVDAMGREVQENAITDNDKLEDDLPMKHNDALSYVRKGLVDLANGLDEGDRFATTSFQSMQADDDGYRIDNEPHLDQRIISQLEATSREAREIRKQLSRTLITVHDAESELRNKYKSFKATVQKNILVRLSLASNCVD